MNNNDNQPHLDGYRWIPHCRIIKHRHSNRQHGGVGLFIAHRIDSDYETRVIDNVYDGILGVLFKHKHTDRQFIVYSCYLPPENSSWGRADTAFFDHLLSQIYLHSYADSVFICADMNARIGNVDDTLTFNDDIAPRCVLDDTVNNHGHSFIDFLQESCMCIVNGRITPESNNMTSVSSKGQAVVDYISVPTDFIKSCSQFNVHLMNDIISENDLHGLLGTRCKAPDHSLLELYVSVPYFPFTENDSEVNTPESQGKRYKFNELPTSFLTSDRWLAVLDNILAKVENAAICQENVNSLYTEFCSNLFTEIDSQIPYSSVNKKMRKRFKNYKPYWDETLTILWKEMVSTEKLFHRWKSKHDRLILKDNFYSARKAFDKKLRQAERTYNRKFADRIEELNTDNPREFWDHINKLGPRKNKDIPTQVYDDNGNLNSDINIVKEKWKSDYELLYNEASSANDHFDENFRTYVIQEKERLENLDIEDDNDILNSPFTLSEIITAQQRLKYKKSVGNDIIPNEILKLPQLASLLLHLYNMCFAHGIIPDQWRKATIVPIPKSSLKDPYVPLNYRGITVTSAVYKLFCCIINNRIIQWADENNINADE